MPLLIKSLITQKTAENRRGRPLCRIIPFCLLSLPLLLFSFLPHLNEFFNSSPLFLFFFAFLHLFFYFRILIFHFPVRPLTFSFLLHLLSSIFLHLLVNGSFTSSHLQCRVNRQSFKHIRCRLTRWAFLPLTFRVHIFPAYMRRYNDLFAVLKMGKHTSERLLHPVCHRSGEAQLKMTIQAFLK